MKLRSITFPDIPMLGNLGHLRLSDPPEKLRGWTIAVRGPAVFLISPRGWEPGKPYTTLDRTGTRDAFEFARTDCKLMWSDASADTIDSGAKWTGEPLGVHEESDAPASNGDGKDKPKGGKS